MADFYRATLKGTIGGGEIWMAGFALQHGSDAPGLATMVRDAVQTRFSGMWGDSVTFQAVRIQGFGAAGGTPDGAAAELPLTVPQGGGGNNLPPEVAVVVTLRTGLPGLTGRFYLPAPPVSACGAAGIIAPTFQTTLATKVWQLFQDDLGAASEPARVGVYSKKEQSFYGALAVDVGNVFDAQRRRRNKLVETRISHNIA